MLNLVWHLYTFSLSYTNYCKQTLSRGDRDKFVKFAPSLTETNNYFNALGLRLKYMHSFFSVSQVLMENYKNFDSLNYLDIRSLK